MLIKTNRYDVDVLATNIARWAEMAKVMPPAYMAHGISEPLHGSALGEPSPEPIGRILDGKGLYLNTDLKSYGITKPIPHVYERSLFSRLRDKLRDDRGAISTYDGIINARANGSAYDVMATKISTVTVANVWSTLFRTSGLPSTGTYVNIPTGAVPDETNVGALTLGFPNTSGGNSAYLLTYGAASAQQINMYLMVDLLVAAGNILCTSGTAQTVSSAALTRYTTGAGVYMTFDVTTPLGSTAQNITVSYTNQAGTPGQSTGAVVLTPSAIAQRMLPIATGPQCPLAAGDSGVRAVATVTMSATNTAGVLALNLYKPVLFMPGIIANVYSERDSTNTIDGLVQIQAASNVLGCLALYVLPNTTSTGIITAAMRSCYG